MKLRIMLLLGLAWACSPRAGAQPVPDPSYAPLDRWVTDDHEGTLTALAASCDWFRRRGSGVALDYGARTGTTDDWGPICEAAADLPADDGDAVRRFFELREEGAGAQGAIAATLTPLRSMAVDRRHIPLGVPLWIELDDEMLPDGSDRRLVFAQDVGGAVRGRVRGDLFWGAGEEAERHTGNMNSPGRYYMLVPREEPLAEVVPPPLPAGLYFRQAGYSTCDGCETPTSAVVLGIVGTPAEARKLMDGVERGVLPLGYPLVAHSDEIGLVREDRGIVVVAGLFPTGEGAEAWATTLGATLPEHTIEPLLTTLDATLRVEQLYLESGRESGDMPSSLVVQIDAPEPVPAWSLETIRALSSKDGDARIDPAVDEPLCHVETGDFFVGNVSEIRGTYYDWAPVRCGEELAYVTWLATMLHSTVIPEPVGTYRLHQLIGAECDMPFFRSWAYTTAGRRWSDDDGPDPALDCGSP